MNNFKFCPLCGAPLKKEFIEGKDRGVCGRCRWISYKNPIPVVACLVMNRKNELLLIKRGVEPSKGCWALPGGFIESDETVREAGSRELKEETGLDGRPGRLVGVQMHQSPMYGPLVVIGIEFLIDGEEIAVGDDAEEACFVAQNNLPDIPFKSHRDLIQQYLQGDT